MTPDLSKEEPHVSRADEQAAQTFLRHASGTAVPDGGDVARVGRAWQAVGDCAAAPELIAMRAQALTRIRRANARRWQGRGAGRLSFGVRAAVVAGLAVAAVLAWQLSPWGYHPNTYVTGIGEQRVIELSDHSRIALDARTRIQVDYSNNARVVRLLEGQAQFSVAKDPQRVFTVHAGKHSVVALGTSFNVEYVSGQIRVAMIEGRVLVTMEPEAVEPMEEQAPSVASEDARSTELAAGEGLRVRSNGASSFLRHAEVEAQTAWRQGKIVFDAEPLSEAVRRLNRYSAVQIELDDAQLANLSVSGSFETGDSHRFVQAMQSYLGVRADYSESGVVHLKR